MAQVYRVEPESLAPAKEHGFETSGLVYVEQLKGIKNVIFDLGGVVIDLKRENAVEALKGLGLEDADVLLGEYIQQGPFLLLESGRITAATFFDNMREMILSKGGRAVSDGELQEAFNRFLVDVPVERLQALSALRKRGYRIFVLSNTNPVMYHSKIADFFRQEGLSINDYFDGVVASFEEGMCKPEVELFKVPLRRYGLKPEETLMLDDSAANCAGARLAGMQAIQVTPQNDMLAIIEKLP